MASTRPVQGSRAARHCLGLIAIASLIGVGSACTASTVDVINRTRVAISFGAGSLIPACSRAAVPATLVAGTGTDPWAGQWPVLSTSGEVTVLILDQQDKMIPGGLPSVPEAELPRCEGKPRADLQISVP